MATPAGTTRVWDRPVRWIHWTLAAACIAAWVTTEAGQRWHEAAGYAALALVALRAAWGFFGGPYARLTQFVRSPRATWSYALLAVRGKAPRYLGHNPLGGWMALALWSCVALLGLSGWLYSTDAFWGEAWLDRTHQVLGWSTLVLALLHVGGVIHTSRRQREPLIRSMLSGDKAAARPGDVD